MRRTRHKLEPQCVHKESSTDKGNSNNKEETPQTNKQKGTHESSVVVLMSVHMLQVCGHMKHVVALVVLLCVINSVIEIHTAKTGLLRCCLHTYRRPPSAVNDPSATKQRTIKTNS